MKLVKPTKIFKFTAILLALFIPSQLVFCAISAYEDLPIPGTLLNRSAEYFAPALKGVRLDPQDPLKIDFIIDSGTGKKIDHEEARALVRYFLAGLTLPQDELWVNLSPYEHDRILTEHLALTDLGKDMLKDDYLLKQFTASVSDPQSPFGKDYWQNIHRALAKKTGRSDAQIDSFCKVWIMPDQAEIYESGQSAVITASRLKVMVEDDYLAMFKNNYKSQITNYKLTNGALGDPARSAFLEEFKHSVLPAIENEVNNGKNFARLRQIYSALILAVWFKDKFKQSFYKNYIDAAKVKGISLESPEAKEKIYAQYTEAFKKGVYDLVQREKELGSIRVLRRHYFSGGEDFSGFVPSKVVTLPGMGIASVGDVFDLDIKIDPAYMTGSPAVSSGWQMPRPGSKPGNSSALDAYQGVFERQIKDHLDHGVSNGDITEPWKYEDEETGINLWVLCASEDFPIGDSLAYSFVSEKYGRIIVIDRKILLDNGLSKYGNKNLHSIHNEICVHYVRQEYWVRCGFAPEDANIAAWYDQIAKNGFELTPLQLYTLDHMSPQSQARQDIFAEYRHFRQRHFAIYAAMEAMNNERLVNINHAIAAAATEPMRKAMEIEKAAIEKEIVGIDFPAIARAEMKFWFVASQPLLDTQEHVSRVSVIKNLLAPPRRVMDRSISDSDLVARLCGAYASRYSEALDRAQEVNAKIEQLLDRDGKVEVKREDRLFTGSVCAVVMKPGESGDPEKEGAVHKIARPWLYSAYDENTGLATTNALMIFELRKHLDMEIKGVKGIGRVLSIGVQPDGALTFKTTTLRGTPLSLYNSPYWEKMDWSARLEVIKKIAEILQSMHNAGYIHIDLKTVNIVMNEFGEVMIIDLGSSTHFDKNNLKKKTFGEGTEGYFPVDDQYYSPKMDVHALGVIIKELFVNMPKSLNMRLRLESLVKKMVAPMMYVRDRAGRMVEVEVPDTRISMAEAIPGLDKALRKLETSRAVKMVQVGGMRAPMVYDVFDSDANGGIDFNRDSFALKVTGKTSSQASNVGFASADYDGFTFQIKALSPRPATRKIIEFLNN